MSRKIKAALIDMDGTLYDSMPNHARAWKRLSDLINVRAKEEEFFLYEGRTGEDIINMLIRRELGRDATDIEKIGLYGLKAEYFTSQPPVKLMPGAKKMVADLRSRGIETILVTGSGQNSLLSRLEDDFPGAFPPEKRVTSASVTHGKPSPEPFLKGLEIANVAADEAIAIDNAPLGTRSARDAGVFTIGVVTGPIPSDELRNNGAHKVYGSMEACADDIINLINLLENTSL